MLDVVNEPKLVQALNEEYYRLINFYSNTKRSANFIKYYNLAMDVSPHNTETEETYDFYTKTANKWDVYELTPMQIISANCGKNNKEKINNYFFSIVEHVKRKCVRAHL